MPFTKRQTIRAAWRWLNVGPARKRLRRTGHPYILEARAQLEDLYGDDIDIVVYEPRPGGQEVKGSLAGQADAG
jgi:hypothetical protein